MKNLSFASFIAVARDVGLAFLGIASAIVGALMRLPLPRLLAVCLVIALLVMVLPMALTLFAIALVVKLVAVGVVLASRREQDQPKPQLDQLKHPGEQ